MYTLEVSTKVRKEIKKLHADSHPQLKKKLQQILKNPKVYGKPLRDSLQGFWRARVDPFRIIYEINEEKKIVILLKVDTRDCIYEEFELPDK
jgi:mRNA interferase RelE/StbE